MNKFIATASAVAIVAAMAIPASAADVNGGSTKDKMEFFESKTGLATNRSGFYITGTLGYADISRETTNTVARDGGAFYSIPANADADDLEEIAEIVETLRANGTNVRGDVAPGSTLFGSIFTDEISFGSDDDASGLVYGGELSYLYHMPANRIGLEIGLALDVYADGDTSSGFIDGTPTITGGYGANPVPAGLPSIPGQCSAGNQRFCVGQPAGTTLSAWSEVDRKYDIDLPIKLHYFLNDRISIFGGAGPSLAVATIRGGTVTNGFGGDYDNAFKDDDTSIGYLLTAGLNWWLTDRVRFGAEYSFKQHSFEADGGKSTTSPNAPFGLSGSYRDVDQNVEADDTVHAVKARLGITLN